MDKRIRDDERAVSELIGEIMLIGIVVIAFGIIAVSVYSYIDKTPDTPHIEVAGRCDIDSDRIYLKHQGGESIGKENLRILVDVGGNTSTFENLDGLWALGSVIGLSTGNITQNDTVRVAIVHVPSGTVITSGGVAEGTFESAATNIAPSADAGDDQKNDLCNDTGILEVTFDGAGSYDSDGFITQYAWDFGDGNASSGASVTHTYTAPDTYTVTLTVTDSDGATASDTCIITIDPAQPLCANAGPDSRVALGNAVELNGSKSTGCIKSWHWDLGDGNTSSSKAATHTYGSTGIYNVTLTVEDYSGEEDEDTATVEVLNATVRIADPDDGDVVGGTVHVDAYVFGIHESGINRVEFFSDSGLIGADSDGDAIGNSTVLYSIVWNTTDWTACADSPEGGRTIYAIVYHSGQTGKSQDVAIEVDNDGLPVITILAPEGGDYVNHTTAIRATVTDDRNTMNVAFLANGVFRGIMSPPSSFDRNWGYRVPVTVHAGGSDWNDTPVACTINFTEELVSLGESVIIDTNSVRVIDRYENGTFVCEVPSRVEWNESGCVAVSGVVNGGFEAVEGWNYTERRDAWGGNYTNATSYSGSMSFLIEYPWNQGSSAGDYAKVTQTINGSQITEDSHLLRVWVRDDYNGGTSGYHFKQVVAGDTVLWEDDVSGNEGGWISADMNISDYIGEDLNLTLRVYDKKGVGNFGVSVWWDDVAILMNTTGDVAWIINGSLAAGTERHYYVYFDTLENGSKDDPGYESFDSSATEQPAITEGDAEIAYPYYTYQWNTSAEPEGATGITVNATDDSCPVNQKNESIITVYVDNLPDPAIDIDSPDSCDNVTGTVNITTNIYNIPPDDATNVEFYILPEIVNGDWTSTGGDTTPAFTYLWDTTCWQAGYGDWEWTAGSTGKYYLRVHLEDRYNQSAKSDPNFYLWVENPAPAINITTPVNGSTVEGSVNITADVTDNGYVTAPALCNITNETGGMVENGSMTCDWWNASWSKRKPITIASACALSDYQINSTIDYESGMQSDFDDIRFVAGDGSELPYWIENKTDGTNATVWVNVSSIPAGNSTIHIYYGNAAATSQSDGDATFDFFDDFKGASLDTDKWSATGSYSVDNDIRINTGSIYTDSTIAFTPENRIFEMRARYHTHTGAYAGIMIADATGTAGGNGNGNALSYLMTTSSSNPYIQIWGADGATTSYNIVSGTTLHNNVTIDADYITGFSFTGSHISYFIQNTGYADIARSNHAGTWNKPFHLWLGYFTGSNAGSANIDDVTVKWVRVRRYTSQTPTVTAGSEEGGESVVCHTIWNTASLPGGNYTICVSATDNANQTETNCTGVYLHNPAPVINIATPANGSTVEGTVTIAADVTDNGYVTAPVTYSITNESGETVETGNLGYWSRRKPINITSSTLLSNYQINLTIDHESEMQSDFDDLRFFDESGSELPYWTLKKIDSVNATVWVNVSSIPAGNSTILLYYGNDAASPASTGDATFDFFDDFDDLDKWTQYGTGSITATTHDGKSVVKFGGCNEGRISTDIQVSGNMSIERMIKNYGGASDCDDWCGIIADGVARVWRHSDNNINKFAGTTGDAATSQNHGVWNYYSGSGTSSTGTGTITQDWKLHSITRLGTTIESIYDGETRSITPSNVLAAGYVQILNDADAADRGGYIDWIRVRKCTTSEPVCVIGSEENSNLYSTLWNTSSLPGGNYTITVSAEDDAGQTNTSCVMVAVT